MNVIFTLIGFAISFSSIKITDRNCSSQALFSKPMAACSPDYEALKALYRATNGGSWTIKWDTTDCTLTGWYGITKDGEGRVTDLKLQGNNLVGYIPIEIGRLINLKYLDLIFNQLSGIIPSEIGNLTHLNYLYLFNNQLSGPIPSEIGNLINLIYIDLHKNQLSGSIPSKIGNLNILTHLYLDKNQLDGSIPPKLGNLSSLKVLDLDNNQLSNSIPSELGNLGKLQVLYLFNNLLSGSIPSALGNLNELQHLYLFNNQLGGSIPSDLGRPIKLSLLYLFNNQLSGSIPSELGNLSNLSVLDLNGNQLSGSIPSELGRLYNLTNLDLNGNKLSGFIPSELGSLKNLQTLYLNNNQLSGPIPSELKSLSNLLYLYLFNNQLTGSIPSDLSSLSSLIYLDLSNNQLSGCIPSFLTRFCSYKPSVKIFGNAGLPGNGDYDAFCASGSGECSSDNCSPDYEALKAFYRSTNGGSWINKWDTTDCTVTGWYGVTKDSSDRVITLQLLSNNLRGTLAKEIGSLINLQSLNLSNNQLSGSIPPEIGDLNNLQGLFLENNQLSGSIPPEFGSLSNLLSLGLSFNQLSDSIPPELGSISNLLELALWNNQLSGSIPPEIGDLNNLQSLVLIGNQLSGSIPTEIGKLSNLQYLSLGGNQLSGSIPPEIGSLSNLLGLDLVNNQLSGSIPPEIGDLNNLQGLYLGGNQLSGCFPATLHQLCSADVYTFGNPGLPGGGDFDAFCANGTGECIGNGPIITSVTPTQLCSGDTLTISGSNFSNSLDPNTQSVKINEIQGKIVSADSTLLKVVFNERASGKLIIENSLGSIESMDSIILSGTPTKTFVSDKTFCSDKYSEPIFLNSIYAFKYVWENDNSSIGLPTKGIASKDSFGYSMIDSFIAKNNTDHIIKGKIKVTPYSIEGCSGPSDSFYIFVQPVISIIPEVSIYGNTLTASFPTKDTAYYRYRWFRDGIEIYPSYGLRKTIHAAKPGKYTVAFSNTCFTGIQSKEVTISVSATRQIYVDSSAIAGNNNGTSWSNAFNHLQDGMAVASINDTILVAKGTYYPDEGKGLKDNDSLLSFNIPNGITLLGGFPNGGGLLSSRDWKRNIVKLSGEIQKDGLYRNNAGVIVFTDHVDPNTVIDGFCILEAGTGGNSYNYGNAQGAWFNDGIGGQSNPLIKNCKFIRNKVTAFYNGGSAFGIANPIFNNCNFSDNYGGLGGAINNSAFGGIAIPQIINSIFERDSGVLGGAIFNEGDNGIASPKFINCLFNSNYSSFWGGVIVNKDDAGYGKLFPSFTNCILSGNSAQNAGGVLWNTSTGVQNFGIIKPVFINSILWNNSAPEDPLFSACFNSPIDSRPKLYNCIVQGPVFSGSTNLVSANKVGVDPLFVKLPSIDSPLNADFHLQPNSQGVDMGINDSIHISIDLDGNPRIVNGIVDIGCYEYREPLISDIKRATYVDSSAFSGLHNGTFWANAYTSLQDALVSAKAGDTILVAQGTYYPDQSKNLNNDDRSLSFNIKDGVVVYGGFPSGGGSLSSRNWVDHRTILSGEIQQDDSRGNNSYHVITTKNVSGMTTLDGLIITSGYANGTAATQTNGGGWYNDGSGLNNISNPTIRNCNFILNYAGNGAGLFNNGDANGTASPTVINSIFMNNIAGSNGGAVYNLATHGGVSNTSLTNCLIRNNNASYGGAMYNNGTQGNCTPALINCLLYLNLAGDGAAISSIGSQGTCVTTIMNSIIWANIKFPFANTNATINLSYSLTEATTGYIDKGNNKIGQNPFFVLINSDLHLTDKSPAINAGINSVNAESKDLDGTARIMNKIIDMGPYEFKANAFANNLLESRSSQPAIDLLQNIPNPFSNQTRIGIYMDQDRRGELRIFDLLGRSIKSYDQIWHTGYNEVRMDESELKQPGVYYYSFESGDFKSVRKMILFE